MILQLRLKVDDRFFAMVEGTQIEGNVPSFMPGKHYGDYVMLDIDVSTGRIVNWPENMQNKIMRVIL